LRSTPTLSLYRSPNDIARLVDLAHVYLRNDIMCGIDTVVRDMSAVVADLVIYLESSNQPEAYVFFTQVQDRLKHVEGEEQLLEFFLLLSMTAFQGFRMDPFATMMTDRVLDHAQRVAYTFSADDDVVH